jgi:3-dehydroquinate dehydratase-2
MTFQMRSLDAPRWRVGVIDGPNMPNLGNRDEAIYGPIRSLQDLQAFVAQFAEHLGVTVHPFASNHEGEILEFIHQQAHEVDAFVINPAGLTTYGEATRHALADSVKPFIEVHFANTVRHFRSVSGEGEPPRSRFTYSATGLVMGLRHYSYVAALLGVTMALDDASFLGAPSTNASAGQRLPSTNGGRA